MWGHMNVDTGSSSEIQKVSNTHFQMKTLQLLSHVLSKQKKKKNPNKTWWAPHNYGSNHHSLSFLTSRLARREEHLFRGLPPLRIYT